MLPQTYTIILRGTAYKYKQISETGSISNLTINLCLNFTIVLPLCPT